jgi:hypothetical protein
MCRKGPFFRTAANELAESRGRGKEGRNHVRSEMDARLGRSGGGHRCRLGHGRGQLFGPGARRFLLGRRDVALRAAVLLQAAALPPALRGALLLQQLLPQAAALPAALCGLVLLRQLLPQAVALRSALRGVVLPGEMLPSPVNVEAGEGRFVVGVVSCYCGWAGTASF